MTDSLFDQIAVTGNGKFASREPRKRESPEQEFFASVLYAAERASREGFDVTAETVCDQNRELPLAQTRELLATAKMELALKARGILVTKRFGISARQHAALSIYFDPSAPTGHASKLRRAGVASPEWEGWMNQAAFAARARELGEDQMSHAVPAMLANVAQQATDGNLDAIKLGLAISKRFDPRQMDDRTAEVVTVLFTLMERLIPDAAILAKIGEGLDGILAGKPVAEVLAQPDTLTIEPSKPRAVFPLAEE